MEEKYQEMLEQFPIVAAVKNEEGLQKCITAECQMVFVLFGDICNIGRLVKQLKEVGKTVFVHIDLVDGLESKEISVRFIHQNTQADGIISTRPALIKAAKALGMATVQRFFLLDSIALSNVTRHIGSDQADFIEVLPAVMPKIIHRLAEELPVPLIAGGLISDKQDILSVLQAGATAISCTNPDTWFM